MPLTFVNRVNELQFITSIYCPPYLLLTAPSGYGKTRLLQAVKDQLERQQWHCLLLNLTNNIPIQDITTLLLQEAGMQPIDIRQMNLTSSQDAGHELGRQLCKIFSNRKNLVILLDNIENLHSDSIQQMLVHWVPAIKATFNDNQNSPQLRFIWAGRNIADWKLTNSTSSIPITVIPLTPFDFEAVSQTVAQ